MAGEVSSDIRKAKETRGVRLKREKLTVEAKGDEIAVTKLNRYGGLYSGHKEVRQLGRYNATNPDDVERFFETLNSQRKTAGPSPEAKALLKAAKV